MNIAQEIYESIQELYQEIIKVDLNTGKATILHSIMDPSDRGRECIWDSHLEKFKGSSFRQDHAEHGVCLFNAAFLSASHGITVINVGSLDTGNTGFERIRITEFSASVGEDIFKQSQEIEGTKTLF